ncbi:hypothetical protein ACFQ10_04095 [Streptomyces indonesiensis]
MTSVRPDRPRSAEPDGGGDVEIVEYTDPACPWAWGSEPAFRLLRALTAGAGPLAPGVRHPLRRGRRPGARSGRRDHLVRPLHRRYRPPYAGAPRPPAALGGGHQPAASLAAKAAERQDGRAAERVLRRLRETTFVLGTPADTAQRVLDALAGLDGVDRGRLGAEMDDPEVVAAVRRDHAEARDPIPEAHAFRAPGPHGIGVKETDDGVRYALPTLVFSGPGGRVAAPGWWSVPEYLAALRTVAPRQLWEAAPIGPEEALAAYRSLTGPDLSLLTGGTTPRPRPYGAIRRAGRCGCTRADTWTSGAPPAPSVADRPLPVPGPATRDPRSATICRVPSASCRSYPLIFLVSSPDPTASGLHDRCPSACPR